LAGQLLEISRHEDTVRVIPPPVVVGKCARVYQFPSKTAVAPPPPTPIPKRKQVSNFCIHLVVELTIGLFFWLVWFVLHLMH
jgi:hypothetical protein